MTIGAGILLFVVGAVLAFAVNDSQIGPLEVQTLGYILMLAGLLVAVFSYAGTRRRHDSVAVTRDSAGRETVTERRSESGGGPVV